MEINELLHELISSWKYKSKGGINPFINFRNLVYEIATWMTKKELIQNRRILKWEAIISYLYHDEIAKIPKIEKKIVWLLYEWKRYNEIKHILTNQWNNEKQKHQKNTEEEISIDEIPF